jgi:hypothetical protein
LAAVPRFSDMNATNSFKLTYSTMFDPPVGKNRLESLGEAQETADLIAWQSQTVVD